MTSLSPNASVVHARPGSGVVAAKEAIAMMFDRHAPLLLAYVSRRVGPLMGEDVVSDVFLVALRDYERFDATLGSERAWLFGIATNLLRRHARTEARYRNAVAREAANRAADCDISAGADDRADAAKSVRQLASALADVAKVDLDVLLLIAWGELTPAEVAEALAIPQGTVRSRLHRVRRQLRVAAANIDINLRGGVR